MQPLSPMTRALWAAGVAAALGASLFVATTISSDNFVAFLPAHAVLLIALILSSDAKLRFVIVGFAALTSMMISSTLGDL